MIFSDFLKALSQLGDRRFRSVLSRALLLTVALLIGLTIGFVELIGWLMPASWSLPFGIEIGAGWFSLAAVAAMIGLSFFMMFPVASVFVGIYLDDVADAVEERHYPDLPQVDALPMATAIADSLRFLLLVVVANMAALFIYLLVPPLAPFVFLLVNGWLLGREYFQLAAARRIGIADARRLAKAHSGEIFVAGVLMAVPLSVPLLNLVVPILGAATFTHMFHRLAR